MDTKELRVEFENETGHSDSCGCDMHDELYIEWLESKLTQPQQTKCETEFSGNFSEIVKNVSFEPIPQNTVIDEYLKKFYNWCDAHTQICIDGEGNEVAEIVLGFEELHKTFLEEHKLQPQTNEGELIEFVNSRLKSLEQQFESPEILDKYRIEVKIEAYKEVLTQFKALQNTNKDDNK